MSRFFKPNSKAKLNLNFERDSPSPPKTPPSSQPKPKIGDKYAPIQMNIYELQMKVHLFKDLMSDVDRKIEELQDELNVLKMRDMNIPLYQTETLHPPRE